MLDCPQFTVKRAKYFTVSSVKDLFYHVNADVIVDFSATDLWAFCCIAYHDCSISHNLLTSFQLYCVIISVKPSLTDSKILLVICLYEMGTEFVTPCPLVLIVILGVLYPALVMIFRQTTVILHCALPVLMKHLWAAEDNEEVCQRICLSFFFLACCNKVN